MKQIFGFISVFLIAGFFIGCYSPSKMSTTNITSNYQDQSRSLNINISAYNLSQDTTKIYYQINAAGLFFQKDLKKNYFFAKYLIKYEVYNMADMKKIVDSASFVVTDSVNYNTKSDITDSLNLFLKEPDNYILAFTVVDLNKKFITTNYLHIYKNNILNRNNFVVRDSKNNPIVQTNMHKNKTFRVFMREKNVYKLFVKYYSKSFPIAAPPYSVVSTKPIAFKPDSIFTIDIIDGRSGLLKLSETGIYHFQSDTSKKEGYTLFCFSDEYPQISSALEMLGPLQYITTKTEFNDLVMMKNIKPAIDNFWLEKAGNPERAKELIKYFYNRVQDANRFFSSYTEGWKTDRGMIYIIFGQPNSVYRSPYNETWYYGEDRNILSMTLDFNKTLNPFTENDYTLNRSAEYKDVWYSAVESWRK
jgi:GWxTD domain-containing protein